MLTNLQICNGSQHVLRYGAWRQFATQQLSLRPHQTGQSIGQHHRGVFHHPAPIARVQPPFTRNHLQREQHSATRAQEQGRLIGVQARAVRGQKQISRQALCMLLAKLAQTDRASLFTRLKDGFEVETQTPIASLNDLFQRGQINAVLAFIVRRPPAVPTFPFDLQFPRRQAFTPLMVMSGHHVAMPIGQNRG